MFKKIIKYTLCFILTCTIFCGCSNQTTQAQVGKELDKKLTNLYKTVKNLDTIDNNYINNPDLQISRSNTNIVKNINNLSTLSINNLNKSNLIRFENETNIENGIIEDIVKKEIEKQLNLNNNGKCNYCGELYVCDDEGYCTNCVSAIICDDDNNCAYCHAKLFLNETNTCNNCNNSYLINKVNNTNTEMDDVILDNESLSQNSDNYTITQLDTKTTNDNKIVANFDSSNQNTTTNEIVTNESTANIQNDYDKSNNTIATTDSTIIDDEYNVNNTTEYIYNDEIINENNTKDIANTDNTLLKTTDTETNKSETDNLSNIKVYYYTNDSFSPIKLKYNPRFVNQYNENDINQQLSNYLYKVQRLYAMTEDALEANNILNTTKRELLDLIVEIRELNENIINGNCTATIQQLQALTNYTYDLKNTIKNLKNCNGDLENEVSNINTNIPATISSSVDVMNSNYVKLINLIDTRITYHESAISTLEQIKYLLEDAITNESMADSEVNDIIEKLAIIEQSKDKDVTTNQTQNDEELISDYSITIISEDDAKNYTSTNENNSNQKDDKIITNEQTTSEEEIRKVSDNTHEEKSIKNIDTYKTPSKNNIEYSEPNNEFVKFNIAQDDNNINTDLNNNSQVIDNNYALNGKNYANYGKNLSNNVNNTLNDNIYKNSVINQNNLNNDDGYGGYYYANDGQIHNNGINNNNEFGNNGNTIENNINRNSNTNTYGYNTMLDIINQGTVNNGINTL